MIKVMNLVGILIAPFAIRNLSWGIKGLIVLVCLILLAIAVSLSKRGAVVQE
jgi:hypothetical protein